MGDHVWSYVNVRTPRHWGDNADRPPWFISEIGEDMCGWNDIDLDITDDICTWSMNGELNYGWGSGNRASEIGDLMRTYRIPFVAGNEGSAEYGASGEVFDGAANESYDFDGYEQAMMSLSVWKQIRAEVSKDRSKGMNSLYWTTQMVEDWFAKRNQSITDLPCEHLRTALCPPNPAEQVEIRLVRLFDEDTTDPASWAAREGF